MWEYVRTYACLILACLLPDSKTLLDFLSLCRFPGGHCGLVVLVEPPDTGRCAADASGRGEVTRRREDAGYASEKRLRCWEGESCCCEESEEG